MNWLPRTRQRNTLLLAMIACVLLLLLAACGAPTLSGNYSTNQQTQYNQPAQLNSNSNSVTQPGRNASQVKNLDRQVQSTLQSLDNTEQNGNSINSGSDNQQMP